MSDVEIPALERKGIENQLKRMTGSNNKPLIRSAPMKFFTTKSKVGEPANNVTVHKQRGTNMSIIGSIAYFGTINFSKVHLLTKADTQKLEYEYSSPAFKTRKAKDLEKK